MEGLESASLRPGHPDFLDLPWSKPLTDWARHTERLEELPRGESRHPVVFVNYEGISYALKALDRGSAEKEYRALREMAERRVPVVEAVGYVRVRAEGQSGEVLVTRYLEHSLPYTSVFTRPGLERYRSHLIGALANLLVELHLAGVYWGDCSLNNALFLRDAGQLRAVLVDAETSRLYDRLPEGGRLNDLEVTEENLLGGVLDLVAQRILAEDFDAEGTVREIRDCYDDLWREVTAEEVIHAHDRYRIEERMRRLNALGFSVDHFDLTGEGDVFRLRAVVTDRNYHRDLLHSLTGLLAQERQAQLLINEIRQHRAELNRNLSRSSSLSGAAYAWLEHTFRPTAKMLSSSFDPAEFDPVERYCELLEHKWFLSERAEQDVGLQAALDDYLSQFGQGGPEATAPG